MSDNFCFTRVIADERTVVLNIFGSGIFRFGVIRVIAEERTVVLNIRLGPEFSMHYILHFVWHVSSLPPTSLISISACPPCDTFSRTDNESTCPHRWDDGTPNDQSGPLAPWFAHLVLSGRVSCCSIVSNLLKNGAIV